MSAAQYAVESARLVDAVNASHAARPTCLAIGAWVLCRACYLRELPANYGPVHFASDPCVAFPPEASCPDCRRVFLAGARAFAAAVEARQWAPWSAETRARIEEAERIAAEMRHRPEAATARCEPLDSARLDPPIAISVAVHLDHHRIPDHKRALRALNMFHGWPTGDAPLDVKGTPEHQDATAALLRGRRLTILVTHVDCEGRPTFALVEEPKR